MAQYDGLLLVACLACIGLAVAAPTRIAADCVSKSLLWYNGVNVYPSSHQIFSSTTQYLQDRTTVQVAQNFEVTYFSTFKVVSAASGSRTENETYILYQCGTDAPNAAQLGLPKDTKMFSVPLSAVSTSDGTILHFMKLLGVLDRVAYVTPYTVDPCMQLLSSSTCGNHNDSVATSDNVSAKFGSDMDAADPLAVMFAATADRGTLNRAEYIKYVATFFNRETAANAIFKGIFNAYTATKGAVADYLEATNATTPVVAWLYYQAEYVSQYYNASERVGIKFAAYRQQYTEDAGGKMLSLAQLVATYGDNATVQAEGDDLVFTDLATSSVALRAILANVDVVIDESYWATDPREVTLDAIRARYGLNDSAAMTELKFFREGLLLRLDGHASATGSTSWYEEAVARPDVVLHELVAFLQPKVQLAALSNAPNQLLRSMMAADATQGVLLTGDACPAAQQTCGSKSAAICPAVYLDCTGKLVQATEQVPCGPTCSVLDATKGRNGGAADRAVAAPALLLLLAATLAAVLSWAL